MVPLAQNVGACIWQCAERAGSFSLRPPRTQRKGTKSTALAHACTPRYLCIVHVKGCPNASPLRGPLRLMRHIRVPHPWGGNAVQWLSCRFVSLPAGAADGPCPVRGINPWSAICVAPRTSSGHKSMRATLRAFPPYTVMLGEAYGSAQALTSEWSNVQNNPHVKFRVA